MHAVPLHELAHEGMLEWAAGASISHGVPDRAPTPLPLPSAVEILAVFRKAGCHGSARFRIEGIDPRLQLQGCPDPDYCSRSGGPDLGEVSLHAVGSAEGEQPTSTGALVDDVSFRKPNGVAALAAICGLAEAGGPQLVFDDSADRVFVVRPGEQPDDLISRWPW